MDLDYVVESGVAAIVANLTAGVPTAGVMEQSTVPSTSTVAVAVVPSSSVHADLPPSSTIAGSTTITSTPTSFLSSSSNSSVDQLLKRVEEGLQQMRDSIQHEAHRPPTVVVVNPPVQIPPSVSWQPDVDSAVAAGVVLLLVLGGVWCWWLRKYRPELWKTVRVGVWRGLKAVALPASWLLGAIAALLHRFHSSSEEQVGQPAAVSQVRLIYIIVSVVIPLGYSLFTHNSKMTLSEYSKYKYIRIFTHMNGYIQHINSLCMSIVIFQFQLT